MWVDETVLDYEKDKRDLGKQLRRLGNSEQDVKDKSIINGMIASTEFALEWLKTGREPDSYGGPDERSIYQKRVLVDMNLFPSLDVEPERTLTDGERTLIMHALVNLSVRERQCYIMHHANQLTQEEIAEELGISQPTVNEHIKKATKKVTL